MCTYVVVSLMGTCMQCWSVRYRLPPILCVNPLLKINAQKVFDIVARLFKGCGSRGERAALIPALY